MRGLIPYVVLVAAVIGCASPPAASPTPTAGPDLPTLPLPEGLSGIPGLDEFGISIDAITPPGSVPVGSEQAFTLGHCGLSSPIDIDGSLWDPVAGEGAAGGPLTETNTGELINSTAVLLVLVDAQTMLMATPAGARILLERHNGPRFYRGCD
jgi:hypothetical protein